LCARECCRRLSKRRTSATLPSPPPLPPLLTQLLQPSAESDRSGAIAAAVDFANALDFSSLVEDEEQEWVEESQEDEVKEEQGGQG
jgi:hypothetical protein